MSTTANPVDEGMLPFEAMYAAIDARDTRFDGRFYTAVTSTGIYCRPSCPAPTPKASNVRFLRTAAQAQQLGFRPCLRCFPEALPGTAGWDPHATLTGRAMALIEDGSLDEGTVPQLAARLGTSSRTLNRVLVENTGAPALAHARALRARSAFRLLASTELSATDVAFTAGFGSVRQFNETMTQVFGRSPSQLRQASRTSGANRTVAPGTPARLSARLSTRGAVDVSRILEWFARRTLPGIDAVHDDGYTLGVALPHGAGELRLSGGDAASLRAHLRLDDAADLPAAVTLARELYDLDADSPSIDAALAAVPWLAADVAARPGARLPGTPTLHEALLRAVTGQQVSVESGRAQLVRLVEAVCGTDAAEPDAGQHPAEPPHPLRPFPTPSQALATLPAWFRGPATRRDTLERVLALLAAQPEPADAAGRAALLEDVAALKGIGPWTIAYVRLRHLADPDVELSGDAALLTRARARGLAEDRAGLTELLNTTRPWRSYAALHLWD